MEQRLAPLFMMSHQQGRRFKRATTVGSYTVQMVKMQRIPGPKEPAELTYYTLYNGKPLLGTTAAKILTTVDSQRMALTLGYVVQVQADPVVKNPPNNLWIIAAVLAPIAVVTVIIIIITAVLCRKNKNDFKADTMMNLPQRAKPVQGFDYAKQHLGQQGAEDEVLPVTQETVVLPLPVRDPASQEREIVQDGTTAKTAKSNDTRKSRSPSENGSVISNKSGKPNSGRGSPQKVMAQQKMTKEEGRKRNAPRHHCNQAQRGSWMPTLPALMKKAQLGPAGPGGGRCRAPLRPARPGRGLSWVPMSSPTRPHQGLPPKTATS
uniref:Uncharacterized protein n=1 Tax=Sphaerodactylus townsendi TaxID=933632 RepID=A0ACB8G368_9SAUR